MYIHCSDQELVLLKKIAEAAEALDVPCYLIGGFVRDKIIGRPTKDIDIVCLGDGIELANEVSKHFKPKPSVSFFKNFGTAQIRLADIDIEFVGARKESYQLDSRNPVVLAGTLADDQNRRDFTINALAISLNNDNYGALIDPFNGINDLENKVLKVDVCETPLLSPYVPVYEFHKKNVPIMKK